MAIRRDTVFTLYLVIGFVITVVFSYKFIHMNYNNMFNWIKNTDIQAKLGLMVLCFINIFAWPISIFLYLKYYR